MTSPQRVVGARNAALSPVLDGLRPFQRFLDDVTSLVRETREPGQPGPSWILDVACGTGTVALHLARAGCAVVGLDPAPARVAAAERRRRRRRAERVTFLPLDVTRDPVPGAGGYDAVVSLEPRAWDTAPARFLAGCRRTLRPGGYGLFLAPDRPGSVGGAFGELRRPAGLAHAVAGMRWLVPALFQWAPAGEPLGAAPEAGLRRHLSAAGFEVLAARRIVVPEVSVLAWTRVAA